MIIKAMDGGSLRLTKTRLTELSNSLCMPRYLELLDLKKGWPHAVDVIRIQPGFNGDPVVIRVLVEPSIFRIGCRNFDAKTFARILKAAGIVQKRTKKRK